MRSDPHYACIRYNLLRNAPEVHVGKEIRLWEDSDAAESRRYIETNYNIHSESKHMDALKILFRERQYHPIQDIVGALKWDGKDRIQFFLSRWMQADSNEYTEEVSRLIFAGEYTALFARMQIRRCSGLDRHKSRRGQVHHSKVACHSRFILLRSEPKSRGNGRLSN